MMNYPNFLLLYIEFAYQLLLTISTSNARGAVNRLLPLLHRDFLSVKHNYCYYYYDYDPLRSTKFFL